MDDRLQSVEGWCGGGYPSVACRMSKNLAVCEVRKSSAVKASAPEVHSGWTRRRPRSVLNVDQRRLGSWAWEMIVLYCIFVYSQTWMTRRTHLFQPMQYIYAKS